MTEGLTPMMKFTVTAATLTFLSAGGHTAIKALGTTENMIDLAIRSLIESGNIEGADNLELYREEAEKIIRDILEANGGLP